MEQTQAEDLPSANPSNAAPSVAIAQTALPPAGTPQGTAANCPTCSAPQSMPPVSSPQYAYVITEPTDLRCPSLGVEKELKQAIARAGAANANMTDRQAMRKALQDNRYLLRQMCGVALVHGIETYILVPRDPADYQLLLDSYRSSPSPGDMDVVIGRRGPIAPPTMCNGLLVPILIFDQIYFFDRRSVLNAIPTPKGVDPQKFVEAAGEMFDRIINQSDNAGATDADRALNYLAVRYDQIYVAAANFFSHNASFTSVEVLPSPLSGTRRIVDVVFAFTDRTTDVVSRYFVRVDVTEEFPFLVTKLSPYYDRQ